MAFVHDLSCECTKSELDLFSVPPTQTSMESGNWIEYHPLTSVTDRSPTEFEIGGTGEDYIDFGNSMLYVQAKITKTDSTNLDIGANTGPVNMFLHSLFSQVDIQLNGTLITSSTNTYPYRAILETLLSYGEDAKKTQLTSALYYKDQAGRMDVVAEGDANTRNDGMYKRTLHTSRSHVVDMMGRIHADIFFQDLYMLNEVSVKIKLVRSKDAFCVMSDANCKVNITKATMLVRKVTLSPSVFLAHAKALENGTAKYPIRRVVCKTFTVATGFRDVSHEKLYSGQLPTRMVVGLVTNQAFSGHRERNPFNFQHFGVSEISLYLDGQQQSGIKPMELNYADSQYIRAYNTLFARTGKICRDEGIAIERNDYENDYALYAFDLTADLGDEEHFKLMHQGNVRLVLKFADALTTTVTVVAYAEFENVIEIDRNRNVIFDFGA